MASKSYLYNPDGPNANSPQPTVGNAQSQKLVGNQLFDLSVTLNNHSNPEKPYILPTQTILELSIEEDLLNWPYKGYLIYKNIYEGLERSKDAAGVPLYVYRMDARDEITIEVKPITDNITLPEKIWNMKFNFIVYDTEDLDASNITNKVKKIYFWDKRYQLMLDKKIQWSTATAKNREPKLENPTLATDEERSMKTGLAIKALLKEAKFGQYIDEENWDKGATTILYTTPAEASINDSLNTLMSSHISENDNDICIFKNDRHTGKWQLKQLKSFFKDAGSSQNEPGPLQIEHLFFEDYIDDGATNTTPFKAPIKREKDYEVDIKANEWNKITNYKFVDMSGLDNEKALVSKPVYWYDAVKKQFGVDVEANEIKKIREDFKKLYVEELYPSDKASPLFTLNKTKKEQYNIQPEFCYATAASQNSKQDRLTIGRNKVLFSGLFLNECIYIRLLGSTHRIAGTFIGIDRLSGVDNEFDKKICGQWFVVNVKHIWYHTKYVNDITAVKIHSYENIKINEDVE